MADRSPSPLPRRALILIDVQNEYVDGRMRIEFPPIDASLANIANAIGIARAAGIPIVVVQQLAPEDAPVFAEGSHGAELHAVVRLPDADLLIQKRLPSALAQTSLGAWLRERRIDTLAIAGYMTQNCNESTVRQAMHEGWKVEYLHDATGAVSYRNAMGFLSAKAMHEAACIVMQSRFAAVMSTAQWGKQVCSGHSAVHDGLFRSFQWAQAGKAGWSEIP